jgi:SAM-dependent methyltransferase
VAEQLSVDLERPTVPEEYEGYAAHKGWRGIDERSWSLFVETFDGELCGIPLAGRRVLEVGFGNGEFLRYARERGAIVTGLEINPELVARQAALGYDARVSRFYDDPSLPERAFHLLLAFDVLEHLTPSEIRLFFRRASEVLVPGGHLALRFPNGQSPFGFYHQAGDITHRTLLTARSVDQLARPLGFRLIRAGNAYRDRGCSPADRLRRSVAYSLRTTIEYLVGLLYFGQRIDLDPNVTVLFSAAYER